MFRARQKVRCIDASGCSLLKEGAVYTVLGANREYPHEMIDVDCPPTEDGCTGYYARRFRPLTNISIFTDMLLPARQKETAQ